jgi:hypothetical protein
VSWSTPRRRLAGPIDSQVGADPERSSGVGSEVTRSLV